jgi:Ca2+-binding EF-hand superfamily protein
MKLWLAGVVLASAAVGASTSVWARNPEWTSSRFETECFAEEDADGDGLVTLLEARAEALALFEYLDRDGDGRVTGAEAAAHATRWRAARFERRFVSLDRDVDGALSPWEIELPPRRFAWADRDRDRKLSRRELWDAYVRAASGEADTVALRSRFWRRDLNGDTVVDRAEVLAVADRRFMRKDRDRNGVLTPGEARAITGQARH